MMVSRSMTLLLSAALLMSTSVLAASPAAQPVEPELAAQVLYQVEEYAQALLDRDAARAAQVVSTQKLERIHKKRPINALGRFIDSDRANFVNAVGEVSSVRGRFSLLRVELTENSLHAFLAFDGRELAKPILFVQENGSYKLDGGPTILSGDNYTIENRTSSRTVGCYSARWATVTGYTPSYKMYCDDIGYQCNYTGTRFEYNGAYHYCDWNTWGSDFIILSNGTGQCNDLCY